MDSHDLETLRALLRDGRKSEAIAAARRLENLDLREALELVNAVERGAGLVEVSGLIGRGAAADPAALDEVKDALARGQKILAIKVYRERFGVGLKDAKEAVEAIERGQPPRGAAARPPPASPPPASAGLEAVKDALRRGQKIEAIKLYRELTGVGLKEAKDAVESMAF